MIASINGVGARHVHGVMTAAAQHVVLGRRG
jgi:hypothetical protein